MFFSFFLFLNGMMVIKEVQVIGMWLFSKIQNIYFIGPSLFTLVNCCLYTLALVILVRCREEKPRERCSPFVLLQEAIQAYYWSLCPSLFIFVYFYFILFQLLAIAILLFSKIMIQQQRGLAQLQMARKPQILRMMGGEKSIFSLDLSASQFLITPSVSREPAP